MTDANNMFSGILAERYQHGDLDSELDLVFSLAASSGVVLLPGRAYVDATSGSYNLDDLLLGCDIKAWPSLSAAYAAIKDDIYPSWYTYNPDKQYFEYNQEKLCLAFIKSKKLTKHKGAYLMDGNPVKRNEVKSALRRTLAIVRKDAGKMVYGAIAALDTLCADDAPSENLGRLTMEALSEEMSSRGYGSRFNIITSEYETTGKTSAGRVMSQDDLVTILHNELADNYKGCSFDNITQYISFIARENKYNPVLDLLEATPWDGIDRMPQLFSLVDVQEDPLSKTLIRKWLLQTVALLFNDAEDPFGADGCLVFNGDQGAGKTSLFRHLAMRDAWFAEGCSVDDRDKDTTRRIVTTWIAELGEVESTLKSDISKLKAFVTAAVDRYRLPYGRSDVVAPRHTALCATCNSERYLIDPTGNRRWWSVPFKRIVPRAELLELDALQLWAQIFAQVKPLSYKEKASCFRLTEQEQTDLATRNGEYEKPTKGQLEVEDILDQAHRDGLTFKQMTVAEFKAEWDILRPYTVQQIGIALKRCGIDATRSKTARTSELPTKLSSDNPF